MYTFNNDEHVHLLDGKPLIGTSTVVSVISKPLTWWASGLACEQLGWVKKADPRKSTPQEVEQNAVARLKKAEEVLKTYKDMTAFSYVSLLDKAYRAHADKLTKSADKGTDMHAELEKYVKLMIADQGGTPFLMNEYDYGAVRIFAEWAFKNVSRFLASEGHCYSEKLWTGGITDCIAELKDGRMVIIDFKSSKEAYLSQFIQVAGYDIEASENGIFDAQGNELLKLERPIAGYVIFPFGAPKVEPQFQFDTAALRRGFESAVVLHKLINQ
jgi:hypothetical protein